MKTQKIILAVLTAVGIVVAAFAAMLLVSSPVPAKPVEEQAASSGVQPIFVPVPEQIAAKEPNSPSSDKAKPPKSKITWEPPYLTETIDAGGTKTVPLSFTTTGALDNVSARVVPAIAPYVTVEPATFSGVSAGSTVHVRIIFSSSADAPLGTIDGTIQIKDGNATIAKPLPIKLTIQKAKDDQYATYENQGLGISFTYPTFGKAAEVVVEDRENRKWITVGYQNIDEAGNVRTDWPFGFGIINNTEHLALHDWFDPTGILITSGAFVERDLKNGMTALVSAGPIPSSYDGGPLMSIYAISSSGKTIVTAGIGLEHRLDSVGLTTPEQRMDFLVSVLETMVVP